MNLLELIFKLLADGLSPGLRSLFSELLNSWENAAKKTKTPIDDIVVGAIKAILGL